MDEFGFGYSSPLLFVSPGRLVLHGWLDVSAGSHTHPLLAMGSVTVSQVVGEQDYEE